jgi:RNA polymerase subunit RPABC4/transcription elongation factor Spt4
MKNCKNCNALIREEDNYCRNCGVNLSHKFYDVICNIYTVLIVIAIALLIILVVASYLID